MALARAEADKAALELEEASLRLRSLESAAAAAEQVAASSNQDLDGRVAELTALLERESALRLDLENQIGSARSEIAALTDDRDVSESTVTELQSDLRSTRNQLQQTDQIVAELTQENQRLQESVTEPSGGSSIPDAQLKEEIEDQAQRIVILRENRDAAQIQIAELTAQLSELRIGVADRETQIASLEDANESILTELAAAQDFKTAGETDFRRLQNDLISQRNELATRDELITELAANVDQLENELAVVASQNIRGQDADSVSIATLSTERDEARAAFKSRDDEVKQAESQLRRSEQMVAGLNGQVALLQGEIEAVQQALAANDQSELIAQLENARDEANADAARIGEQHLAAEAALVQSTATIAKLETDLAIMREDLSRAESGSIEASEQREKIAELESAREAALSDVSRLSDQLASAEAGLRSQREQTETLSSQIALLREEKNEAQSIARAQAETFTAQIVELEVERDQAVVDATQIEERYSEAAAAVTKLETELVSVRADLTQAEAGSVDAMAQRQRITALEDERDTALVEATRLASELNAAEAGLASRQEEISTLNAQIVLLRDEKNEAQSIARARAETFSAQLAEFQTERDQAWADAAQAEQRYSEASAEVTKLETDLAAITPVLWTARTVIYLVVS
ncbi:MAG: hypothetical protein HOH58_14115 [Opitutaceae bacterium]|nr:hypothetical protein [Opitutaceae bacterium]